MQPTERKEFISVLKSTMEVFDKSLSADALEIWWATMEDISIAEFRQAMTKHISVSQFAPKPADILSQFRKQDGRPGAEEAWSMIPKDESGSVIWTDEMAAAYGAAAPLLADGDKIGARMAFKEAYEREVEQNQNKPPRWIPSFGTDRHGREAALSDAVSKKRLSLDSALQKMPDSLQLQNMAGQDNTPQLENLSKIKQIMLDKKPEQAEEVYDEAELLGAVNLIEPDLSKCPQCGGPADNGHDRLVPPNPYNCSKCESQPERE